MRKLFLFISVLALSIGNVWGATETLTWALSSNTNCSGGTNVTGSAVTPVDGSSYKAGTWSINSSKYVSESKNHNSNKYWEDLSSCSQSGCADPTTTARLEFPITIADGYTFNLTGISLSTLEQQSGGGPVIQIYVVQGSSKIWVGGNYTQNSKPNEQSLNIDLKAGAAKVVFILGVTSNQGSNRGYKFAGLTVTGTSSLAASYTITYYANGGSGEMENSTNTVSACTFTAQDGYKFSSWNTEADGSGDSYKAGDNVSDNIELYAQWVEDVPDPTVTFNDGTYIIGNKALNMAEKFTSNSTGAVTYSLKEATENASITAAGLFSATVAGEYIVVASQAAVPATYAAISTEATVIVMDYEQSDTYVWKKDAKYTGCVTNPNADAPAALYTDITYEGFTGMGRAATANTECILTFSIKGAYSADHRIKSICTYGKLEEPLGGQISWDGGTNWEDLAAYTEGKKEFEAPAGTHATSFKIKFMGVSTSSGGLWWRNALVTLDTPFDISIDGEIANGSVAANVVKAYVGDEVTVSNTPAEGYKLGAYDVYKTGDATTKVTVAESKFTMPAYAVIVSASFVKDSGTALDNTDASVKAVKVLRDGQLFIEKNGHVYNVFGACIK